MESFADILRPAGNFLLNFPWRYSIDVALMAFIVYQVYARLRGTRAMRILAGIVVLGLSYLVAQAVGLFLTSWVLGGIWAAALIFVIVIFQSEIRHMLEQVNPRVPLRTLLRLATIEAQLPEETLATIAKTAFSFGARRCGALFVFERDDLVEPLLKSPGTLLNADISPELLETIFTAAAPLHDGALYVRGKKAYRAGSILPLSDNQRLAYYFGTRHRAALGISEQSDALAVVVSEERGKVSVVDKGAITVVDTPADLLIWLSDRLRAREPTKRKWSIKALITHNWRPKLASLVGVSLLLFFLVGQQNAEVGIAIPVVYLNIPRELTIEDKQVQEVYVRVRGSQEMLNFLDPSQLQVAIDLKKAKAGLSRYSISAKDIKLPLGLKLAGVNPSTIVLNLRKKPVEVEQKG